MKIGTIESYQVVNSTILYCQLQNGDGQPQGRNQKTKQANEVTEGVSHFLVRAHELKLLICISSFGNV